MAKSKSFSPSVFVPYSHRNNLSDESVVYDVSSYAEHPFCTLSPMWPHEGIPIPGMPGKTSDSVEGIWQGLKVIRGDIAPRYFSGRGHKRGGKPAGHQFGNRLLKIVEARFKIYKIAYEWVLENRVEAAIIDHFVDQAFRGITQFFHDVEDNGDINNSNSPLAHATLLVQYVNRVCVQREQGN